MEEKLKAEGGDVEENEDEKVSKAAAAPAAETTSVSRTFLNTNQCETMLECVEAMFNIIAEEAFNTVDLAELHYADPIPSDGKDYIS